jgi:subtilase family serine protease
MHRPLIVALAAASLLASAAGTAATAATSDDTVGAQRVCAAPVAGNAACDAQVRTRGARPDATTTRGAGYISADLRSAYNLANLTSNATVAIVDAYAHPDPAADLNVYRTQTSLAPLGAGQFTEYGQSGGPRSAAGNTGWGQEEMLDLEMVSAICPTCKIAYVGANSASFTDLAAAVNFAATIPGVVAISNSYGAGEFNASQSLRDAYNHPGIAITVSSGDSGYGVQMPAAFNTVTAVGGTSLTRTSTGRLFAETAWSGAGSGCSAYISKPSWQTDGSTCGRRTVADVSAVADPNTGVAVYDSYGSSGGANWYVFGGTSVAAPIIGAVYALSGNTTAVPAALAYSHTVSLFDVTSGSNGRCVRGKNTSVAYLCTAGVGFDGPTGLGTPNGTGAF